MLSIDFQAKILDHDNVNYLKKILGELAMVLDQVEAELEKRKLEYQGEILLYKANQSIFSVVSNIFCSIRLQVKSVSCGYVDLNLH